jgi:hypothetical protein
MVRVELIVEKCGKIHVIASLVGPYFAFVIKKSGF